jgi:hypothetical protein
MKLSEVRNVSVKPPGHRVLGYFQDQETDAAALFDYHGHRVWIPKKALRFSDGHYTAPAWAIDSSKAFQERRG